MRILCVCCPRKIRRKYQPTMRSKASQVGTDSGKTPGDFRSGTSTTIENRLQFLSNTLFRVPCVLGTRLLNTWALLAQFPVFCSPNPTSNSVRRKCFLPRGTCSMATSVPSCCAVWAAFVALLQKGRMWYVDVWKCFRKYSCMLLLLVKGPNWRSHRKVSCF